MKKLHDHLILAYVISSILATICLLPYTDASYWFYLLGGSSSWYALGYIFDIVANPILGILAFGWMILFPILMIPFYILTRKEIYLPFFIIVAIDAAVVLMSASWIGFTDTFFGPDLIVSTAFTLILGGLLLYRHNHLEKYL